jgi:hypothetical protein
MQARGLSSIWDLNSSASPVYCADEQTQQNHRLMIRNISMPVRGSLSYYQREITALLAKLYAEQMISLKEKGVEGQLPEDIPELMLSYLNELNRRRGADDPDNRMVHSMAKTTAWECLKQTFRPQRTRREVVADALGGETSAERYLRYFEDKLYLIQTVGAAQNEIRFSLDPLAEYLAGLKLTDRCDGSENEWRNFLDKADRMPDGPAGIKEFLLAVRDCCLAKSVGAKVPDFVPHELAKLAGLDPEAVKRAQIQQRVRRLIFNFSAPDAEAEDRVPAAEALGRIGPEAKEAIPALVKALRDEDKNVREAARWALENIGRLQRSRSRFYWS